MSGGHPPARKPAPPRRAFLYLPPDPTQAILANMENHCHFIGDLKTAQLADSKWEVLLESFQWEFGADTPITVPAGVVSDGGPSVPPYPIFVAIGTLVGVVFWWLSRMSPDWAIWFIFAFQGIAGVIRHRIRPNVFKIVGYLHDWLRCILTTGNATTDAMLRDAAYWNRPDKLTPFDAWLIYVGVRIGTYIGFKSNPPQEVIDHAIKIFAGHIGVKPDQIEFVPELSLVKLKGTQ